MSHFTKAKTKVTDGALLKKALTHLGWEFQEGDFTITQYGTSSKAQILLDKQNKSVGLCLQEDGTWAMVGDPYHAPHNTKIRGYYRQEAKFAADLQTAYSIVEAKEKLEAQQYMCTENAEGTIGTDGKIRMVFQSLA